MTVKEQKRPRYGQHGVNPPAIYRGDGERTGRARGIGVSPKFELLEIYFLGVTTGFSRLSDIRDTRWEALQGSFATQRKVTTLLLIAGCFAV